MDLRSCFSVQRRLRLSSKLALELGQDMRGSMVGEQGQGKRSCQAELSSPQDWIETVLDLSGTSGGNTDSQPR